MTNRTPTENERIALLRGWRKEPVWNAHGPLNAGYLWVPPPAQYQDRPIENHSPDYLHEWEHAGSLLEELISEASVSNSAELAYYGDDNPEKGLGPEGCYVELGGIGATGKELPEAISRAWLAWKEEERSDG